MPWGVEKGHGCQPSKPWAVFRLNPDGSAAGVVPGGCHVTKDGALAHQRALYANEPAAAGGTGAHMRAQLTVPVEWKTAGGAGELEGYASVFGNIDQGGDVVVPGAFKKTLNDWRGSGQPMPLIADHDLSTDGVIGSLKDAREDKIGLWVRAGFSATPKAQDIRTKMIEGHLRGMSFTYEAIRHHLGDVAGKSVRFLDELRLFEATVTPFPMNLLAVASAKADRGNIETAAAADLDAAARAYAESQGWAMPGGSYPIRPANMHGAEDLASAIRAVGRGSGSHDAIRRHIMTRARAIGMSDQIPGNWSASGAASLDFIAFADAMRGALAIPFEPASKAAVAELISAWHPDPAVAAQLGTAEPQPGPPDVAPGGEPPTALAGTIAALETQRARNQMDRLQAELTDWGNKQ